MVLITQCPCQMPSAAPCDLAGGSLPGPPSSGSLRCPLSHLPNLPRILWASTWKASPLPWSISVFSLFTQQSPSGKSMLLVNLLVCPKASHQNRDSIDEKRQSRQYIKAYWCIWLFLQICNGCYRIKLVTTRALYILTFFTEGDGFPKWLSMTLAPPAFLPLCNCLPWSASWT